MVAEKVLRRRLAAAEMHHVKLVSDFDRSEKRGKVYLGRYQSMRVLRLLHCGYELSEALEVV